MRYERLKDILDLAVRLQGTRGGLTLDDIEAAFSISRRTAERRPACPSCPAGRPRRRPARRSTP